MKRTRKTGAISMASWNVNGVRACVRKGGWQTFLDEAQPDIICLQEVRAFQEQVNLDVPDYHIFWNPAEKPGYSGVAIVTREQPENVIAGLGLPQHDGEGRVLTAEYADFYLVTVYTPNAQRGLARLNYRTEEWDPAFLAYVKKLEAQKPVIFCGDLNVAHKPIDLADPKGNERNAGFTIEERNGFDRIVESGFIDCFREFTEEGGHYTWWSHFGKAREKNHGWRIDYFCVSSPLRGRLEASFHLPHLQGSDHCPVMVTLA